MDILCNQNKFTIKNLKDDTLLNFNVNQEKHVDKVLKKFVEFDSMTGRNKKLLTPVGSRPSVMYSSCKVYKASVKNCMPL